MSRVWNSVGSPCFGPFQVDLAAGELRKGGSKIRLQKIPFQILTLLLERAGEVVTREELHELLWPGNYFVEFDHNLNNAMNKLRDALCDSAEEPRYIETLPRRGYRFIAEVTWNGHASVGSDSTRETEITATIPARPARTAPWRGWLAGVAAGLLVIAVGYGLWLWRTPRLAFQQRDWVLIGDFDNRTGEAVFDGTLEQALARELSNSPFVNVASHERVQDALVLMKKPPVTPVDRTIGREICLRDGEIRALLTGSVQKLGSRYLVNVDVVEPVQDVNIASFAEEAADQGQVLLAMHRLSNRLREKLGENLARFPRAEGQLEKVITPSLRAAHLYSNALPLVYDQDYAAAVPLLQQAVAEDPNFAAAHIFLAYCLNEEHADEAAPHFERAMRLSVSTTDRERYTIQGMYYSSFQKDYEKARVSFQSLLRLYPQDYWGALQLSRAYDLLGRSEEGVPYYVLQADLRPKSFETNWAAAMSLENVAQDLHRAKSYVDRALDLASPDIIARQPAAMAWLYLFPFRDSYAEGHLADAEAALTPVADRVSKLRGATRDQVALRLGEAHLALGQLRAAEHAFEQMSPSVESDQWLGVVSRERGDQKAFVERVRKSAAQRPMPLNVLLMLDINRVEARGLLSALLKKGVPVQWADRLNGCLAVAEGRYREGAALLGKLGIARGAAKWLDLVAAECLSRADEALGDSSTAIRVLDLATAGEVRREHAWDRSFWWIRTRFQLAELCRRKGRIQEAQDLEAEIQRLLARADPDYPMLLKIKQAQSSPVHAVAR